MKFRKDIRTDKQFEKDIAECTAIEQVLMQKYVDWLNSKLKDNNLYFFEDNGVDNSGNLIRDDKKVSTKADFLLKREGKPNRKIEIKFARKDIDSFHLKTYQLEKYILTDTCIVNFTNSDSDTPKFCILTPKTMSDYLKSGERVVFWQKPCVRFSVKDEKLNWVQL